MPPKILQMRSTIGFNQQFTIKKVIYWSSKYILQNAEYKGGNNKE